MKNESKIKRVVLKSYDDIYKTAKSVTESYGTKALPLTTLKYIIGKIKIDYSNDKEAKVFIKNYKVTLNSLYNVCETTAKNLQSKSVPIGYLKACIDVLKKSFSEGFNKQ